MDLGRFYRGKTVIVTGDRGLLGTPVSAKLKDLGANVIGVNTDMFSLTQQRRTREFFHENPADLVIHLAARVSGIGSNAKWPAMHIQGNAEITLNVVNAIGERTKPTPIVAAGSVCAYASGIPVPSVEQNLWEGRPEATNLAYGASKRFLLDVLEAYHVERKLSYVYILQGNMYGPGDEFSHAISHVIPGMIYKVQKAIDLDEDEIVLWGTGKPSRDFVYASDAADAYILAGVIAVTGDPHKNPCNYTINVASGQEVNIFYLAEQIVSLMGYEGRVIFDTSKPDGEMRRCWRIHRARETLGWTPSTALSDGLRETISWYRQNFNQRTYHSSL
jgi:GDP-L-fucose synthase